MDDLTLERLRQVASISRDLPGVPTVIRREHHRAGHGHVMLRTTHQAMARVRAVTHHVPDPLRLFASSR